MKLIIILLTLALFSATASAISPDITYSTETFLPNTTAEFMTANFSNENFTASELSMVYNFPFTINMTHYIYANHTEFVFTSELPAHISENRYFGTLYLSYLNDTLILPFNISVGEHTLWQIDNSTIMMKANVSQEYVVPIAVKNLGNIETTLSINITGNCTVYTTATQDKVTYPKLDNELLLTFNIPDNHTTMTDICEILVYNADNHSDSMAFNISLNISDNILPEIEAVHIYDSMALKDNKLIIVATDNVIVKNVTGTIIYDNLTYWYDNGTRFERLENVTAGNFAFIKDGDEWSYIFKDTERIDKYYVNYTVTDSSNNTVIGYKTFNIEELDCLYHSKTIDAKYLKYDTETVLSLLSSDFDIPVTITIADVTILESIASDGHNVTNKSYLFGIKGFDGSPQYFSDIDKSITLDGTGSASLMFSANYMAQFVFKLNITTVEEHVPVDTVTFTVKTIEFDPPYQSYKYNPLDGILIEYQFKDNDNIEKAQMLVSGVIDYPYFLSDENIVVIRTVKDLKAEQDLWTARVSDKDERIQSVETWLSAVSVLAGLLLLLLLINKYSRPFIYLVGK